MIKAKKVILLVINLIIFLQACAQPKYLEEMGLQIAIGYDRVDKDEILGTTVYHNFDPESSQPVQTMETIAKTSKGARQGINLESNKKLVSGQIRLVLYGEQTAKKGIIDLVDSISRDPNVGSLSYLGVVRGMANDLLTYKYEHIDNIGSYLYEMIDQNVYGEQMVSSTLHEFLYDYYSEGKDPILPIIERNKDQVKIIGIGAFKEDQMVAVLPVKDSFCIKLLRDRFKMGTFEVTASTEQLDEYLKGKVKGNKDTEIYMSFDNIRSKTDIKLIDADRPEFQISIKMETTLQEISKEIDLSEQEVIQAIERTLDTCMKEKVGDLIKKLQKLGTDPVGFGQVYRSSIRFKDISREEWMKLYKDAKITIKIKSIIVRTGVLQ